MTENEKATLLGSLSGEGNSTVLTAFLSNAKEIVMNRMYPFGYTDDDPFEVPSRYEMTQIEIANELLARRGAEGQNYHSENGIIRTYDSSEVSPVLLKRITPFVGVL